MEIEGENESPVARLYRLVHLEFFSATRREGEQASVRNRKNEILDNGSLGASLHSRDTKMPARERLDCEGSASRTSLIVI